MSGDGLKVAITGPTGAIGRALVSALEDNAQVTQLIGMARSPFDPSERGWTKLEYTRGDITDRDTVARLVRDADVVVHLAFLIFGDPETTRDVNLKGARNVFAETIEAGAKRLIYTSSVAAYGFHEDNPDLLDEGIPPRGTDAHYYSAQKAEVEAMLEELSAGSQTDVYVFRPCIVAGPEATELIENIPYVQLRDKVPDSLQGLVGTIPLLRPVIPDPGVPFQLVHEDDVAAAIEAAAVGREVPGAYNLAADGEITLSDLAHALGWYTIPVPELMVDVTAKVVSRLPLLPAKATWINALRVPVLMDCDKAKHNLGWDPKYDALETLAETIRGAREKGLISAPGQ